MSQKILISASEVIQELRRLGRPSISPGFGAGCWGSTILNATQDESWYTYSDYECGCLGSNKIYPNIRPQYPVEHLDIDYSGDIPSAKPSAMGPNERYRHYGFKKNGSENARHWTPLVKSWLFDSLVQGIWVTPGFFKNTRRFLCKCTLCDTYSMVLAKPFDHKKNANSQRHVSLIEWQTSQKVIEDTVSEHGGLRLLWNEPVILPRNEDGSVPDHLFEDD